MKSIGSSAPLITLRILIVFILSAALLTVSPQYARAANTVLFASPSGITSGNCDNWANACDLQYALSIAVATNEIWVMQGTYKPTTSTDRAISFALKDNVSLYGGFMGTETNRNQRSLSASLTILSGNIGTASETDNSYHVVVASNTSNSTLLDGFTITDGFASGDGMDPFASVNDGAGIYSENGNANFNNIILDSNTAFYGLGGGMANYNGSPTLSNITFSNNHAYRGGGGMVNSQSNATLTNVTFDNNSSDYGQGGGVLNGASNSIFTNITFSHNTVASGYGGGMFNFGGVPILNNITFTGNTAYYSGGALYNHSSAQPLISNSIFWGNLPQEILNDGIVGTNISVIKDSVITGGCPIGGVCTNILTADPMLGALADNGGPTHTIALGAGSSAINAGGKNSLCASSDQRGVIRPQGIGCDIGAYEASAPTSLVNSILPTSRSVAVGTTATVYHSVINAGTSTAFDVTLSMNSAPAGTFSYQQTDCVTNALIGLMNPVLDIPPGGLLCYALFFTPSASFAATPIHIQAQGSNTLATTLLPGINTWLLRSTISAESDIIAQTTTADFHQLACSGAMAFAVATANIGTAASGDITVTANTGAVSLPINISISETNPGTGAIIGDNILSGVGAGENRTVAVFVTFNGCVNFNPAINRIFIEFRDASNNVVGSTSTAVSTNR